MDMATPGVQDARPSLLGKPLDAAAANDRLASSEGLPDSAFYRAYDWCLNPILTIADMRLRVRETAALMGGAQLPWQLQECRVNLYILLCALSCTASDYLCYRPWTPKLPGTRTGRVGRLLGRAKAAVNALHVWTKRSDQEHMRNWMPALEECVADICRVLIEVEEGAPLDWSAFAARLSVVVEAPLPREPLSWRMRIPEAFRCQDMTHHDVITMAQNYLDAFAGEDRRAVFVIGPRTAGAYFVPLVKACFEHAQRVVAGAVTIRPKEGLSETESRAIREAIAAGARLVVIDDHPNTGYTFQLILRLLTGLGASAEGIVILAPDHAAQADWTPLVAPVRVITLKPEQFYKARLLRDDARLLECVQRILGTRTETVLSMADEPSLAAVNVELVSHYSDSFLVRQKRVFAVGAGDPARRWIVLAKSVGWGWLGYHAYLAAERLDGFVPRLLGFHDGMMFVEWVGSTGTPSAAYPADANAAPAPADIATVVPAYLAARVKQLAVTQDSTVGAVGYRVTGRDRILNTLRRPYGPVLKHLLRKQLDQRHGEFLTPVPAMTDGRMTRENWVAAEGGVRKVDFEQHNFGGAEENIVDAAYDLAGVLHDLALDANDEARMVGEYVALTGDAGVVDRLTVYKLRVGLRAIDRASDTLMLPLLEEELERGNLRFLAARNFLTDHLNRHHRARIDVPVDPVWGTRIVLLDLDGVFDTQLLGYFPHTTPNGLAALRLLQTRGFTVVPNTGRSIEHVRGFCDSYGLPGGFAEYGTVFYDRVDGREELLFGADARAELERCRVLVKSLSGVHVDPGYRGLVRAYRYRGTRWAGLDDEEIQWVMRAGAFKHLKFIAGPADVSFVPKGCDKASVLGVLRERLDKAPAFTAAIGDSDQDLPILKAVNAGFVVANGSVNLKALARSGGRVRLAHRAHQNGLLDAVCILLREQDGVGRAEALSMARSLVRPSKNPVDLALAAADLAPVQRFLESFRHL